MFRNQRVCFTMFQQKSFFGMTYLIYFKASLLYSILVFLFGWKKMMLMMPTGSALNYLPTIAKKVCFQGSQIQTNLVFVLFPQQFEVFIFLHHHHPLLFHHHLFFINFTMRTNTFAFAALQNLRFSLKFKSSKIFFSFTSSSSLPSQWKHAYLLCCSPKMGFSTFYSNPTIIFFINITMTTYLCQICFLPSLQLCRLIRVIGRLLQTPSKNSAKNYFGNIFKDVSCDC